MKLIAALMLLGMIAPASAGPKEDAFAVIEQFKKAYDASDPPAIVKLFAPDAIFLGTRMQRPTRDKEDILTYFQQSAAANLPKKVEIENFEVLQLSETAILFSGQDMFSQTTDGKIVPIPARFTIVVTRGAQGWGISHFHSSARPQ
jgi:uncharacterized protein (TIGR02246 family)